MNLMKTYEKMRGKRGRVGNSPIMSNPELSDWGLRREKMRAVHVCFALTSREDC